MVFSSVLFIFAFLPAVLALYTLARGTKAKNIILAAASVVFYAVGEPMAVLIMLLSVIVNYFIALGIGRKKERKALLVLSVLFNVGILFVFKYLNLTVSIAGAIFKSSFETHILLPVGISFFTFQIMSYVVDVYRGDTKPQKSFLNVLLYISFFPQLIAGPIVKYHEIEKQILERKQTADGVYYGIKRFCAGLAKKVLIADILSRAVDYTYSLSGEEIKELSALTVLITAVCYSLQIYFDFSGYSDMAIGMASMFGFKIRENFNYPFISGSIKEFWRRWHISLSTWFKEYVYIPLGGNRRGRARTYLNKAAVFLLTGIWHGANFTFLIWGMIHGAFIIIEDLLRLPKNRITRFLSHIYTLAVVCLSFVLFRADSISQAGALLKRLFVGGAALTGQRDVKFLTFFNPVTVLALVAALAFSVPVLPALKRRVKNKKLLDAAEGVICLALFALSAVFLITNGYSPNIYNQF